ncbi:uncharacterized protein METZ01_LOCUS456479, partial [marine metagenome]
MPAGVAMSFATCREVEALKACRPAAGDPHVVMAVG